MWSTKTVKPKCANINIIHYWYQLAHQEAIKCHQNVMLTVTKTLNQVY